VFLHAAEETPMPSTAPSLQMQHRAAIDSPGGLRAVDDRVMLSTEQQLAAAMVGAVS